MLRLPSVRRVLSLVAAVVLTSLLLCCRPPDAGDKTGGRPTQVSPGQEVAPSASSPAAPIRIEPMVVFEEPTTPAAEEAELSPAAEPQGKASPVKRTTKPRVALIIDDMGYHQEIGDQLLQLDLNLTFSFLPDGPYTNEQKKKAKDMGREILIHLPMEPKSDAWNPGPSALLAKDPASTIQAKMLRLLETVPEAQGANNHMGSRFTEDAESMRVVMTTLKQRSLFFVDSFTTAGSRGFTVARQEGVPTARRHIFLDNVHQSRHVCRQIEQLIAVALKQGKAIGIGHPNQATLLALTLCKKNLLDQVEVVRAGQLVE